MSIIIEKKLKKFNETIICEGDKSLSHRGFLIASQCRGTSCLKGVLEAEDVAATILCLKKLGVKILKKKIVKCLILLLHKKGIQLFHH